MSLEPPARPPRAPWPRLALVALFGLLVASVYLTGLHEQLRWDQVHSRVAYWQQLTADHLVLAITLYFILYVTSTALSLPFSIPLSLLGGALFGRWLGPLLVSLASTGGACLAFLASRYLFRDWIRYQFAGRLMPIERGIERDGAWFLLTLRMMPVVPFFLINLGMGLTPLPLWVFAGVSWLGMLPATFVLVNAGTEIAHIQDPRDVLSPSFLLALTLIGVLPLVVRYLIRWISERSRAT
ncbi:MAG: TVP38/TMEM64 family protein [Gemmataceae bacterium]